MAESDPTKIRAYRQNNDPHDIESEEDPLVELARIVSEDSGFQSRQARPDARRAAPVDRDAFSADLEAELLQELESSFSARPAQPRPAVAPPVQPVAREDNRQGEPMRGSEPDFGDFDEPVQPARSAPQPARPAPQQPLPAPQQPRVEADRRQPPKNADDVEQSWDSQFADPEFQPAAAAQDEQQARRQGDAAAGPGREAREEGQWTPAGPRGLQGRLDRPAAHRNVPQQPREEAGERQNGGGEDPARQRGAKWRERVAERQDRQSAQGNRAEQASAPDKPQNAGQGRKADARPGGPGGKNKAAGAGFAAGAAAGWSQLDDDAAAAPVQPAVQRPAQPEWPASGDYRDELRTTFGDMDEAQSPSQRRAPAADHVEPELTEELEASYSDPSFDGQWDDQLEYEDSDEPRVAAASPRHGYATGTGERGRSRKALVAIAGVLGVVLIGGTVAAFLGSDGEVPSGPPPVIAAQDGPVKIVPEGDDQADEETAGEAVYNRVAGRPAETDEQIVDGAEEPREISRVVLPAPTDADQPLVRGVGEAQGEAGATPDDLDVGPRRVRTYVVRPDGTIVASSEPGAAQAADQGQQVAAADTVPEPLQPDPVQTTAIGGRASPGADSAGDAAPVASAPVAVPVPQPTDSGATAIEQADAAMPDATELAALGTGTEAADAVPVPAPPAVPEPQATAPEPSADAPVELLGDPAVEEDVAAAPTAAPALPPGETGYVVQVSSQRSMEQAQSSFAALQSSYPSVLGPYQADIQQAEVADQGTYYRVRVGPWATRAEAIEVCEALQAAGGSCFVGQ